MEAIVVLVPAPDFKSGGGRGDTSSAGSIPVRFRHMSPRPSDRSEGGGCSPQAPETYKESQ